MKNIKYDDLVIAFTAKKIARCTAHGAAGGLRESHGSMEFYIQEDS